jgi:hypothetical protein
MRGPILQGSKQESGNEMVPSSFEKFLYAEGQLNA